MGEYELWVGGQTNTQTDRQKKTHKHIDTMTRPGLGAGPSENPAYRRQPNLLTYADSSTPANLTITMLIRLVRQDRNLCLGGTAYLPSPAKLTLLFIQW